jgi:hypothetical protein
MTLEDAARNDTNEREKRDEEAKQLRLAYGRIFGSEDGKLVMADLKRRYGWRDGVEMPCYTSGLCSNDFIHREGMREPVRYILRLLTVQDANFPLTETTTKKRKTKQ